MKAPYDDVISEMKERLRIYNIKVIIYAVILILYIGLAAFLGIGFIVHWMKNDSYTFAQMVKWSLGKYAWAYIYVLVVHFSKSKISGDDKDREYLIKCIDDAEKKNQKWLEKIKLEDENESN